MMLKKPLFTNIILLTMVPNRRLLLLLELCPKQYMK